VPTNTPNLASGFFPCDGRVQRLLLFLCQISSLIFVVNSQQPDLFILFEMEIDNAQATAFSLASTFVTPAGFTKPAGTLDYLTKIRVLCQSILQLAIFVVAQVTAE